MAAWPFKAKSGNPCPDDLEYFPGVCAREVGPYIFTQWMDSEGRTTDGDLVGKRSEDDGKVGSILRGDQNITGAGVSAIV